MKFGDFRRNFGQGDCCPGCAGEYLDFTNASADGEITALRAIYDEDRAEMMRLEDYFTKLGAEREAQLALERKKAEELARQQAQQVTLAKAAVMLQKMWRGRCARRALERARSGKKGAKGKGDGKKGKKK